MGVTTETDIDYGRIFGPFPSVGHIPETHFIGLLTTDEREDTALMTLDVNTVGLGVSWLPYVRPARTQDEQNMEAYMKEGRIYYRALRIVRAGEEVLVWYSKDFIDTIGMASPKLPDGVGDGSYYRCKNCGQKFRYVFPLMAHTKFRCVEDPALKGMISPTNYIFQTDNVYMKDKSSPTGYPELPINTFGHNLRANQLQGVVNELNTRKRLSDSDDASPPAKRSPQNGREENNNNAEPVSRTDDAEGYSAFRKVGKTHVTDGGRSTDTRADFPSPGALPDASKSRPLTGTNAFIQNIYSKSMLPMTAFDSPLTAGLGLAMSNWVLPSGRYLDRRLCGSGVPVSTADRLSLINNVSRADVMRSFSETDMLSKQILLDELRKTQRPYMQAKNPMVERMVSAATPAMVQRPVHPASMAQNWCAKCNATFRMTSDLVYHMRSHHKREFDPMKKKREDKLQCNVCNETFKERHHLTRHMTSHA